MFDGSPDQVLPTPIAFGYPHSGQETCSLGILQRFCDGSGVDLAKKSEEQGHTKTRLLKKPTVILYLYKISHNLKRVAARRGTPVLFSAPRKLSSMVPRLAERRCGQPGKGNVCSISHGLPFVNCVSNVIYEIHVARPT